MKTFENFELYELTTDETQKLSGGTWWWYEDADLEKAHDVEKIQS